MLVADRNATHLSILAVGDYFSRVVRCVDVSNIALVTINLLEGQKLRIEEVDVEIASENCVLILYLAIILFYYILYSYLFYLFFLGDEIFDQFDGMAFYFLILLLLSLQLLLILVNTNIFILNTNNYIFKFRGMIGEFISIVESWLTIKLFA